MSEAVTRSCSVKKVFLRVSQNSQKNNDGKLQNLISRKSMPPFENQPFADVLQSRCSQYLQENTCARVSFLIKLQTLGNFIEKEALAQVFSYEIWEIFMNTFL